MPVHVPFTLSRAPRPFLLLSPIALLWWQTENATLRSANAELGEQNDRLRSVVSQMRSEMESLQSNPQLLQAFADKEALESQVAQLTAYNELLVRRNEDLTAEFGAPLNQSGSGARVFLFDWLVAVVANQRWVAGHKHMLLFNFFHPFLKNAIDCFVQATTARMRSCRCSGRAWRS